MKTYQVVAKSEEYTHKTGEETRTVLIKAENEEQLIVKLKEPESVGWTWEQNWDFKILKYKEIKHNPIFDQIAQKREELSELESWLEEFAVEHHPELRSFVEKKQGWVRLYEIDWENRILEFECRYSRGDGDFGVSIPMDFFYSEEEAKNYNQKVKEEEEQERQCKQAEWEESQRAQYEHLKKQFGEQTMREITKNISNVGKCGAYCPFEKSCANHITAGNVRCVNGFTPQIFLNDETAQVFCKTFCEKPDKTFWNFPINENELSKGFVPILVEKYLKKNVQHKPLKCENCGCSDRPLYGCPAFCPACYGDDL